jgi:hypothetical protein
MKLKLCLLCFLCFVALSFLRTSLVLYFHCNSLVFCGYYFGTGVPISGMQLAVVRNCVTHSYKLDPRYTAELYIPWV